MFLMIDYVVNGSRSIPFEFTLKETCLDDEGEDLARTLWCNDKMDIFGMRLCDNLGRTIKTFVKGGWWIA